ncbi:MAG TPA: response regulator [Pseudomonas xinjiangensis]|uniref:Response regulator n=2 Tax=root TaxID=1 RepID=A0A7V1FU67_9GAMM|nr:response regulator [Halopseudomonas xinjiangensis]HEC47262.1 response regulator [Halopseudomonas xinjiangensis]
MSELERVMHIEDDPSIREVARIALEVVGGFIVKSCSSGQEGLDALKQFTPDLILLDVMMPGMDGPQTLAHLRTLPETDNIPVVFMTAKVQPSEVAEYQRLGAAMVITKPFDPMTLPDQIRAIWRDWHGQD